MKDPHAVALGRKGGKARARTQSASALSAIGRKGANARERKLTAVERSKIARIAAKARWGKGRKPE
jgi:hypothetical protein